MLRYMTLTLALQQQKLNCQQKVASYKQSWI